jgi:pimeloyl-ACP methyl ester carboxylesterase
VFAIVLPAAAGQTGCRGPGLSKSTRGGRAAHWRTLGVDGATLVGHSNSAGIALVSGATMPPGRVRRLVLADAVGAVESPSYWQVILGRVLDGVLEPVLSLTGWHHLVYNACAHTRNFFRPDQGVDRTRPARLRAARRRANAGRLGAPATTRCRRTAPTCCAGCCRGPTRTLAYREPRLDHHQRRGVRGRGHSVRGRER